MLQQSNQALINQLQTSLQQMQSMEQGNGNQLRQIAGQLQQIAQHEQVAVRQIQQLGQLCNQLIQENQRLASLAYQPNQMNFGSSVAPNSRVGYNQLS
jgi:uncharacterized sporulation protein YeaH/YhbH (DUF444 family)